MTLDNPVFQRYRKKVLPVWGKVLDKFEAEEEKQAVVVFAQWVLTDTNQKQSVFRTLRGESIERVSSDLKDISMALVAEFKADLKKLDLYQAIFRQYVLIGKELELWSFDLPKLIVIAPREKNPVNLSKFLLLPRARRWREALMSSLKNQTKENLSSDEALAQIILSAVYYGGLINTQLLIAFLLALKEIPKYHGENRYLDLSPTWQGHENIEYRRWFFDPLTELLMMKYKECIENADFTSLSGKWIHQKIYKLFKHQGVTSDSLPAGINEFFDAVGILFSINLPPFLVNYCQRKQLSHSLQTSTWVRLDGQHNYRIDDVNLSQWQQKSESDEPGEEQDFFYDEQIAVIRNCLKAERTDIARQELAKYLEANEPSHFGFYVLLADWFKSLLDKPKDGHKPLRVSTLRTYLSAVGRRLAECFDSNSFTEKQSDDFEDVYSIVLDSIESKGLRRKSAKIIFQFHSFIAEKYQIAEIDYHAVLGISFTPVPVDANLIWVDEYYQILKFIEESDLIEIHPDLVEIAQLLFILGYRCGLRRMEALKLRLIDFQEGSSSHLVIRPHQERRLKTANSQRLVPVHALLNVDELKRLEQWKVKRLEQENNVSFSEYLFALPDKGFDSVSQDLIFPILHAAMRAVTGDEKLRYHHLRHSFASLTLLKLMASSYGIPLELLNKKPLQQKEIAEAGEFRERLLPVVGPTRKYLYAVGRLLGHSGPDISLEHYIHVLDILLLQQLRTQFSAGKDLLVSASALPLSTSYRVLKLGELALLQKVRKQLVVPPAKFHHNEAKNQPKTDEIEKIDLSWLEINKVWQILLLHFKHGLSATALGERFQLSEQTVLNWIENSKKANIKNSLGQQIEYPNKPSKQVDIRFLKPLAYQLQLFRAKDYQGYLSFLELYLKNFWVSEQHPVFSSLKEAKLFLTQLKKLDIGGKNIDLTILVDDSVLKQSGQHAYWHKLEKLVPDRSLKTERGKNKMDYGSNGYLRVKVLNEDGLATPAFRFVMQLILIKEGLFVAPKKLVVSRQ